MKTFAALLGFVILGLSPSFIDVEQSPEKRNQVFLYYSVALVLIYIGVLK